MTEVPMGPIRTIAWGGIAFGVVVLFFGLLFLLINQRVIVVQTFDLWTVCSIGLIALGVIIIGGVLWGRRMMRGGWRRWMDWDEGWRREPPMPP